MSVRLQPKRFKIATIFCSILLGLIIFFLVSIATGILSAILDSFLHFKNTPYHPFVALTYSLLAFTITVKITFNKSRTLSSRIFRIFSFYEIIPDEKGFRVGGIVRPIDVPAIESLVDRKYPGHRLVLVKESDPPAFAIIPASREFLESAKLSRALRLRTHLTMPDPWLENAKSSA